MTPLSFLGTVIAGGIGAAIRYVIDGFITSTWQTDFPLATALINISGSFLLGLVAGLPGLGPIGIILGIGLLGGYTTFSTASFETIGLARDGRYAAALVNGLGMLAIGFVAAFLGFTLTRAIS